MVVYNHQRVLVRKKLSDNTWVAPENAIVMKDVVGLKINNNIGKRRDTFSFDARNHNNRLHETFYSGDGTIHDFTLSEGPIPSDLVSGKGQKVYVYISGVLQATSTYTISGSTLSFTSAPATGDRNIRVVFPVLSTGDLLRVYFWKNNDFSGLNTLDQRNALFIEGTIIEPKLSKNGKNKINVRGFGLIDTIFSGTAFSKNPTGTNYSHLAIQGVLSFLNNLGGNEGRQIYGANPEEWSKTGTTTGVTTNKLIDSAGGFNSEVLGRVVTNSTDGTRTRITNVDSGSILTVSEDIFKTNGDSYYIGNSKTTKEISYNSKYRTAIEIIEELSRNSKTGDGQYIYWVEYNTDNDRYDFIWLKRLNNIIDTLTEGSDMNHINVRRAVDDVVNAVIFNAGNAPNGTPIEGLNFNPNIVGFGVRWRYVSATSGKSTALLDAEFQADKTLWNQTSDGQRDGNYPKSSSYPYTFTFDTRDSNGIITVGTKATASTDSEFNDVIYTEAYYQAKEDTNDIIQLFSNPRYKADLEIPTSTTKSFPLGEVFTLDIPSFGLNSSKLRLIEIERTINKIIVKFEEDEETLEL